MKLYRRYQRRQSAATCRSCGVVSDICRDPEPQARQHVEATGHEVRYERSSLVILKPHARSA